MFYYVGANGVLQRYHEPKLTPEEIVANWNQLTLQEYREMYPLEARTLREMSLQEYRKLYPLKAPKIYDA